MIETLTLILAGFGASTAFIVFKRQQKMEVSLSKVISVVASGDDGYRKLLMAGIEKKHVTESEVEALQELVSALSLRDRGKFLQRSPVWRRMTIYQGSDILGEVALQDRAETAELLRQS